MIDDRLTLRVINTINVILCLEHEAAILSNDSARCVALGLLSWKSTIQAVAGIELKCRLIGLDG